MIFAIKMSLLDNTYDVTEYHWILMYLIILIASFLQNLNFKIQMFAGNKLKICVDASFEISSTLVRVSFSSTYLLLRGWCHHHQKWTWIDLGNLVLSNFLLHFYTIMLWFKDQTYCLIKKKFLPLFYKIFSSSEQAARGLEQIYLIWAVLPKNAVSEATPLTKSHTAAFAAGKCRRTGSSHS